MDATPPLRSLRYYALVPWNWLLLTLHNTWGILNVLDIIWLRPMPGGLIDESHPFCTGLDPATGSTIWHSNLLFSSPRPQRWPGSVEPEPDATILERTGRHLSQQVQQAAASAAHPQGRASRMPPGILYLHGGVHYNGGWMLFNDFQEAISHFTDPRFLAEFRRFVREQKREPITLFRNRDYDRDEFARFVCFMRTILPWFSNSNGPKKFVLWGNPAPYPAVNTITGHWIHDCRALQSAEGRRTVARPPPKGGVFSQRTLSWRTNCHPLAGTPSGGVHAAPHRAARRAGESLLCRQTKTPARVPLRP